MKLKQFLGYFLLFVAFFMLAAFPTSAAGTTDQLNQMSVEAGLQLPVGMQEAATTLREGLKQLEMDISVTFTLDSDHFDGTQQAADELAAQIQELALAHTGVPDEGDYLLGYLVYLAPTNVHFTQSADGWQFTVNYYCAYWATAQQEAELDAEIERLVSLLNLKSDLTDYQKITAIYNYICDNVVYDYEHKEDNNYPEKQTAYAAAVNKTAVCQGYATLFYRLALEAGVDCRYVTGFAGENHAWNLVKLDGRYYWVDSTWDSEAVTYQYFLKSSGDFWDHQPDARYETDEFRATYPIAQASYRGTITNESTFVYQVYNDVAILLRYNGSEKRVVVPSTLGGYPLVQVASLAFYYNDRIESITFSEGLEYIESEAIFECKNLKAIHLPSTVNFTGSMWADFQCRVVCGAHHCPSVETITVAEGNPYLVVVDNVLYSKDMTILRYYPSGDPREVFEIPEGVLSIGAGAFNDAKNLKEVIMSDSIVRVQFLAFNGCSNLESVTIGNGCRFIDQYVFSGTALKSIHIPASVNILYSGTFGYEHMVETVTVDPQNPVFYVEDNVLYAHYTQAIVSANYTPTDSYMPGDYLVLYPHGKDATIFTVPEGIVGIEQHAFDGAAHLQEIILPDSLRVIHALAFSECSNLTVLTLPKNLKSLDEDPFRQCSSLIQLVIPASVDRINYYFVGGKALMSSFEQIVFLGDMPELYYETFQGCDVDIYYPAGNTTYRDAIEMNANSNRWHVGCAENYDAATKHADYENVWWIEACETHQFVSKTQEATCLHSGYVGQECSVCGLVEITGAVMPAPGHERVYDYVREATCTQWGSVTCHCATCGEYIELDDSERLIHPTGHNYDENGNCTNCSYQPNPEPTSDGQEPTSTSHEPTSASQQSGSDLSGQDALIIYLVIFAVVIIFVVIGAWLSKKEKNKPHSPKS